MGVLEGKAAIVTGAGQGIGKGVALALAKEGAAVSILEKVRENGAQTAKEIIALGGRALALPCDVSRRSDCDDAVAATVKAFGTVDILVNNAGVNRAAAIEAISDDDISFVLGAMLAGSLYLMQACFPHMKQNGGKIVNFGSGSATMGMERHGSYNMAKEAIRGLTKTAAREWGPYGINVNVICPKVMTPLYEAHWKTLSPTEQEAQMKLVPMGRQGDAEKDVGRTVVFLASSDSDMITGRTIHVDGGRSYYDM